MKAVRKLWAPVVALALYGVLLTGCDPVGEGPEAPGTFEVQVDPSPSISPWSK
jgi:hypothetical protein